MFQGWKKNSQIALKTNPYLEFAVITRCLRISLESIFTGLNNLVMASYQAIEEKDTEKMEEEALKFSSGNHQQL